MPIAKSLAQRLAEGTERASSGCLLWVATVPLVDGYVRFTYQGRKQMVHRAVWEDEHGPIPEGWQVDHVRSRGCVHRSCVELAHLEAVPAGVNTQRSSILTDRCRSGKHDMTEPDAWLEHGRAGRTCRRCNRESAARFRQRLRVSASADGKESAQ